jgi:glutamate formiminotransferase
MLLIESVPNVSEGRRTDVVDEIAAAVRRCPGLRLLDYSGDPSHNRSVFTMAGDRDALTRAIFSMYEIAISRIDLRAQRGEHPRIGAVDVVPFVPLTGATMLDCIELSRAVAGAVSSRFEIPVFLYEEAASTPARRRLEQIRRGGLTDLATRMTTDGWAPDFGPRQPHPSAGVSVIGARAPLIAFNVNLATDDLDIARRIAEKIRESGGGLPSVKALGLRLAERGIVQVSMNLTDYQRTSMRQAFDAVANEASALGARVLDSELIGLVPAAAMQGIDPADVKLRNFSERSILEERLKK